MKPKEHGAYAILAIPIATGLIVGGFTMVGCLVAIASSAGFLAHEPLLVTLGHRGGRAQQNAPSARRRLLLLLAIAAIAGVAALLGGDRQTQFALIICLLLAIVSFMVAVIEKHRTLGGQLWGVIGLSAPALPILLAGGISVANSLLIWLIWILGFSSTTVGVRGVIAAQKRQPRLLLWSILAAVTVATVVGLVLKPQAFASVIPMVALSWYLMLRPPHAKHLKRVGWTLVVGTIATGLLVAFRF